MSAAEARRCLLQAGIRAVRYRRDVALLVRDGALPRRAADRFAALPTAYVCSALFVLPLAVRNQKSRRPGWKENRHPAIPDYGRSLEERHSKGTPRRRLYNNAMGYL